jgi:hypothetical protein
MGLMDGRLEVLIWGSWRGDLRCSYGADGEATSGSQMGLMDGRLEVLKMGLMERRLEVLKWG